MKCFRATSLLVLLGLMVSVTGVTGQEKGVKKDDKKEEKKDEPKPKDGKESTAKSKGQLPTYWGQLGLTDLQKQGVYKLQGKYNEETDKLEAQIKELKAKMTEERTKILTVEQKKRLEEILKLKAGTGTGK